MRFKQSNHIDSSIFLKSVPIVISCSKFNINEKHDDAEVLEYLGDLRDAINDTHLKIKLLTKLLCVTYSTLFTSTDITNILKLPLCHSVNASVLSAFLSKSVLDGSSKYLKEVSDSLCGIFRIFLHKSR